MPARKCEWCGRGITGTEHFFVLKRKRYGHFCCRKCLNAAERDGFKGSAHGCCGCLAVLLFALGTSSTFVMAHWLLA